MLVKPMNSIKEGSKDLLCLPNSLLHFLLLCDVHAIELFCVIV